MASLNFDAEKVAFRDIYGQNSVLFADAVDSFRTLVALLLADHDSFPTPTVTGRVKDREECIQKFARKYQTECEEKKTPYEIRNHITDLLGVRVVCLYQDDIPKIREIVSANFEIKDETDKSQFLESQEATFGYKGLHLDIVLKDNRKSLPEYRRFRDFQFELQIRTIAQDAWSTIDHKIKYKKEIPHALKRRINRLAALFELADQEFLNIRNDTTELERIAEQGEKATQLPAITVEGKGLVLLNAFTFLSIMKDFYPDYGFQPHKVDGFVSEIRHLAPELSPEEFRSMLQKSQALLEDYRKYQGSRFSNRLNPYTTVRHALYASDSARFSPMLFDLQRSTFEEWRKENKNGA